jgi:FkbH-like protein
MMNLFNTNSTVKDLSKNYEIELNISPAKDAYTKVSIAVLGNFSTQYLVKAISLSLQANMIYPEIYESGFDQWEFDLRNIDSELYKRTPDYLVITLSSQFLINCAGNKPNEFIANLKCLIEGYKGRCKGDVILTLPESMREGYDQSSPFYRFVKELQLEMLKQLNGLASLVDLDSLIMEFGMNSWYPEKYLHLGKFSCHPNCYPLMGNRIGNAIVSLIKRPIRLIIVDLDNTLWGGVVGDDGWENVDLSVDSVGYFHLMLQRYLFSLKNLGVLLAISSKNSHEVAKKVFDDRPEMVLKFNDFICTEINWGPKSESVSRILKKLNLTETGLMFLDDSAFEREEVRSQHANIIIPDLSESVQNWCYILSKSGYFSISKTSNDDMNKSSQYLVELQRQEELSSSDSFDDFLKKLDLKLYESDVSDDNFDRVFELIHKTNQFNLTTKRYSRTELQAMLQDKNYICKCYRLQDKYSDYGIIGLFFLRSLSSELSWEIDTWLMSCRAMGRGVERTIFGSFINAHIKIGSIVQAEYIKTPKNKPVSTLLDSVGFAKKSSGTKLEYVKLSQLNDFNTYVEVFSLKDPLENSGDK